MTWVHDQIFAAGGDHVPAHWADFAQQTGVEAVLHLRPGQPARFKGDVPLAFLWISVAEEGEAGVEERWLAGTFIADSLSRGMKVLLHSSLGLHRVRWAFVAFQICSGQSLRSSLSRVAQKPWLTPYRTNMDAWKAFAAAARGRPDL